MAALSVGHPPSPASNAPGDGGRKQSYLHAGELIVASEPTAIVTILGSCVSVCLWEPEAGVGGMNHYLLPFHVEREQSSRFGSVAIPRLVERVLAAGADPRRLQAKVFGGASVIGAFSHGRRLGDDNARLALDSLDALGIPVIDQDVGGTQGRKLVFHSDDGAAWIRLL
ncbi:MAG TPA: chemotaxis protein CheD [Anaeromyxobacteraceae bacterium]|nr:chemotaxis protein CheD [Anaeromyxobacteraceae bacterium]